MENETPSMADVAVDVLFRSDGLAQPGELLEALAAVPSVWAVALLTAGVFCIAKGYLHYRVATIGCALVLGLLAGYALGQRIQAEIIVAGCLGLLFAVCCLPLTKYAVAVLGGLTGAFMGSNLWVAGASLIQDPETASLFAQTYMIGGMVGLVTMGLLTFVLFRFAMALFTSLSGSTIAVLGALALVLQVPGWNSNVVSQLSGNPMLVPILVVTAAAVGMILHLPSTDQEI